MKQGVGSVRITARGMSKGRMLIQRLIRASRSVSWRLLGRRVDSVQEVMHARKTRINFLAHFVMAVPKEILTASGGGLVDYFTTVVGTVRSEPQ